MITRDQIIKAHQEKLLANIDVKKIKAKNFKVVLDTVNGAGGEVAKLLLEKLNCDIVPIHQQTDMPFERVAEPLPVNLTKLGQAVLDNKADLGFATDPDADRLVLVDDNGQVLSEEYTLALAVKQVLSKKPGPMVINLSTSNVTAKIATQANQQTFRAPVGEANVSAGILNHQAIIGGEGNGGVIYPRVNLARDSFVGMALVLELVAETGKKLSILSQELPKFYQQKEKLTFNGNLAAVFTEIKNTFHEAASDEQDGLRLDWLNGSWVQIRASNTEPIIRLIAESESGEETKEILQKTQNIILNYAGN